MQRRKAEEERSSERSSGEESVQDTSTLKLNKIKKRFRIKLGRRPKGSSYLLVQLLREDGGRSIVIGGVRRSILVDSFGKKWRITSHNRRQGDLLTFGWEDGSAVVRSVWNRIPVGSVGSCSGWGRPWNLQFFLLVTGKIKNTLIVRIWNDR